MKAKDLRKPIALIPEKTSAHMKKQETKRKKQYSAFNFILFCIAMILYLSLAYSCLTNTYDAVIRGFTDNSFGKAILSILWEFIRFCFLGVLYAVWKPAEIIKENQRKRMEFVEDVNFVIDEIQNIVFVFCMCAIVTMLFLFLENHISAAITPHILV